MAGLATTLLLWPTITEKLLSSGAFVSLDSALFWLITLMLADNASEDYFEEVEADPKGDYGQVITQMNSGLMFFKDVMCGQGLL